jgi:hypothetical protein
MIAAPFSADGSRTNRRNSEGARGAPTGAVSIAVMCAASD